MPREKSLSLEPPGFKDFVADLAARLYSGCFLPVATATTADKTTSETTGRGHKSKSKSKSTLVKSKKAVSALLKRIINCSKTCDNLVSIRIVRTTPYPTNSSHHPIPNANNLTGLNDPHPLNRSLSMPDTEISSLSRSQSNSHHSFSRRNPTLPCNKAPAFRQTLPESSCLENHHAFEHTFFELTVRVGDIDSEENIARNIFLKQDWETAPLKIHRIFKIIGSDMLQSEYEKFKRSAMSSAKRDSRARDHKMCKVNGNELVRFHCTKFGSHLGCGGNSGICNERDCGVCRIMNSLSSDQQDVISMFSSSLNAHLDKKIVEMSTKGKRAPAILTRAMLICRVVAGWPGCDWIVNDVKSGEDGGVQQSLLHAEEIEVLDRKAVLPRYVVVYSE